MSSIGTSVAWLDRLAAASGAKVELDAEGHPGTVRSGHAAVRFTNPTTGGDALVPLRMEMHRLARGAIIAETSLDLFTFSDAPVCEALNLADPEEARR